MLILYFCLIYMFSAVQFLMVYLVTVGLPWDSLLKEIEVSRDIICTSYVMLPQFTLVIVGIGFWPLCISF
jgi:hypothetical protein